VDTPIYMYLYLIFRNMKHLLVNEVFNWVVVKNNVLH
jgi:hypothetical protein